MSTSNRIVLENQKAGNPESEWGLAGPASTRIAGFTADFSTDVGGRVDFKISTDATDYRIEIYRLGYYGGMGARKVATIDRESAAPQVQPKPLADASTGLVDAGNWDVSASWLIPEDAVSGAYVAKLVREDGIAGENHIPFIVRDDSGHSDIVFQTSDTTTQAYNEWGGASLYGGDSLAAGRAFAVSYNRPISIPSYFSQNSMFFDSEYPAIRWLERNGYDVSYISGVDTARYGKSLLDHKVFLSVGHDEYWSGEQRANVEAARDAGVNLAFWSGNEVFWKTRWEQSLDQSKTDYRTLISYKESLSDSPADPSPEWTGVWRDPASSDGARPENALTGTIFMVNGVRSDTIEVPFDFSQLRFWRNTSIATLKPGETASLSPGALGYEWDINPDNGFRPAGLIDLSATTVFVNDLLVEGLTTETLGSGQATHNLTLYRVPSGALVFGAGSVFWSWNLDENHDVHGVPRPPVSRDAQQAMVNLFADMGVQPGTLQADLVAALPSSDRTAPISTLSSFHHGGNSVTVSGSAWDLGGGVVAQVEVSHDGGATWHRASGGATWTYSWVPYEVGTASVKTRAVDDSLNLEISGGSSKVVVGFEEPGFDRFFYAKANVDVSALGIDPYEHYAAYGWREGRDPNAIFSTSGYLSANKDVRVSGTNPLSHYEQYGWKEGRDPSTAFDASLYLQHNPDVRSAGLEPLGHYLTYGKFEGRQAHDAVGSTTQHGFDAEYYLLANADVGKAGLDAYSHYLASGWKEGRNPNSYFDSKAYLDRYADVGTSGINPLVHYEEFGWREGRDPSARFDTTSYLNANPDVAAASVEPLQHFLQFGVYEGRSAYGDAILG